RALAAEQAGERDAGGPRRHLPAGHLERRLGHVVTAHVALEQGMHLLGTVPGAADQALGQPLADRPPGGVDRLRTVVRPLAGDALARADWRLGGEVDEEDGAGRFDARGDAERLLEDEGDLSQGDALDAHGWLSLSRPARRGPPPPAGDRRSSARSPARDRTP